MYISRDKSGNILLSVSEPKRLTSYWLPIDNKYMVVNSKFGEILFPNLKWQDEPIEITITLNNLIF